MNRLLIIGLLAGVLASGSACGDVASNVDAGTPDAEPGLDAAPDASNDVCSGAGIALADFNECYIRTICLQLTNCDGSFGDVEECLALFNGGFSYFSQIISQIVAAIETGRVNYDATLTKDCFDGFAECRNPDSCELLFVGTTPNGGACFTDFECGNGGNCATVNCNMQCCTGVCEAPVGEGASCENNERCENGLHCVALPGVPSTCRSGAQGESCANNFDCDGDLRCGTNSQCQPRAGDGGACMAQDSDCLQPLDCINNVCQRPDTEGDLCNNNCLGSFYCDRTTAPGVCRATPGQGQSCAESNRCAGIDLDCNDANLCVTAAQLGENCADRNCKLGLRCATNMLCAELLADGQPCNGSNDCDSGVCNAAGVCEAFDTCYE